MSAITKFRLIIRCLPSGPLSQNQFRRHNYGWFSRIYILYARAYLSVSGFEAAVAVLKKMSKRQCQLDLA